jgi:hypothetical protein
MIDFIKNCPVHNTLKNGPDVDMKLSGLKPGVSIRLSAESSEAENPLAA